MQTEEEGLQTEEGGGGPEDARPSSQGESPRAQQKGRGLGTRLRDERGPRASETVAEEGGRWVMAEDARKDGQVILHCLEGGPVIRRKDRTYLGRVRTRVECVEHTRNHANENIVMEIDLGAK